MTQTTNTAGLRELADEINRGAYVHPLAAEIGFRAAANVIDRLEAENARLRARVAKLESDLKSAGEHLAW